MYLYISQCLYIWTFTSGMERLKLSKGILQPTRSEKENSPGHTHDFISKGKACLYIPYHTHIYTHRPSHSILNRNEGVYGGSETTTCQLTFAISGLFSGLNCSLFLAFLPRSEADSIIF